MRGPLTECPRCHEPVFRLRHANRRSLLLVDVAAHPRGYLLINEMMGTYQGQARPGIMAHRKDLHLPHKCLVNKTEETDG